MEATKTREKVVVDIDEDVIPPPRPKAAASTPASPLVAGGLLLGLLGLLTAMVAPAVKQETREEDVDVPSVGAKYFLTELVKNVILEPHMFTIAEEQALYKQYQHNSFTSPEQKQVLDKIMGILPHWLETLPEDGPLVIIDYEKSAPVTEMRLANYMKRAIDLFPGYQDGWADTLAAFKTAQSMYPETDGTFSEEKLVLLGLQFVLAFLQAPHTSTWFNIAQAMRHLKQMELASQLFSMYSCLGSDEFDFVKKTLTT